MANGQTGTIPAAKPVIDEAEIDAVIRVLRSGMVVQGPEVQAFEAQFSEIVGGRHCVAVNSGTSALHLTLMAMGIGPGDEVIVPSFSFAATANAVRLVGAVPVFADIDPESYNLDPDAVSALVGPKTVAIMPVHLYGLPADMEALVAIADRHALGVIEDAAQAHAAAIGDRPVGTYGDGGCFSFYPTKNMHSLEGGMIATGDAEFARQLRLLRNQGMEQRYSNEIVGTNTRMTDVAAAIGRVQLGRLPEWTDQRRANAAALDMGLANVEGVSSPSVPTGRRHVYHQYTIRIGRDRDLVSARLKDLGIGNAVYYPTPIHRLTPFLGEGGRPDTRWDLPETDRAADEVLSLPVFPGLRPDELDRIVDGVRAAVEETR